MRKNNLGKHLFSFYVPDLTSKVSALSVGQELKLSDLTLFHRLFRIVRFNFGDACIFFDRQTNILIELLSSSGKKDFTSIILKKEKNKQLQPSICFWLPFLKRDHFQTALYSLAELGVNQIQPVFVQKGQRNWAGEKEFQRCQKILVSAAEQSKNFAFPQLFEPKTLQECCDSMQIADQHVFFDSEGEKILQVLPRCKNKNLVLFIGPEGDLTDIEKMLLKQNKFIFCSLTPTILRAVQAAAVSVGVFRTFLGQ